MPYPSVLNSNNDQTKSAFRENLTAEPKPLFQVSASSGITNNVRVINIGGTTFVEDGKFVTSTGTGANNVSAIVTAREAKRRPGQGLSGRFSFIFIEGRPDNTQEAGFITSESSFVFSYNGTEFGILHAANGALEHQDLTITTGAAGAETATIVVDGVSFNVSLTAGTPEHNAYEIATSLQSQFGAYTFTSNGAVVTALARISDLGGGNFTFSSTGSAVASWSEITNGRIPDAIEWIPKHKWNVRPDINIDPTLGNVGEIVIGSTNFGGIHFYIEDPKTSEMTLVHVLHYSSTSTTPIVDNAVFRIGWGCRNNGNTTDVRVSGDSCAAFVQGDVEYNNPPSADCNIQPSVGLDRTNVMTFRNRTIFQGVPNRNELIPTSLVFGTESTKAALFEIVANPEVASGDSLEFEYLDETESLMEVARNAVTITGGTVVYCVPVKANSPFPVNIQDLVKYHAPGFTFSITARITGGTSSEMVASGAWIDDL